MHIGGNKTQIGRKLIALLATLSLVVPATISTTQASSRVDALIEAMSTQEKVTQLLMPDFRNWAEEGQSQKRFTVMNEEVENILDTHDFGGVILFAENVVETEQTARPLFKRLNLSWNLVTLPIFAGMATFTLSMLPGTPARSNFIPSNALGSPLTAAPVIGIIVSLIVIVYVLIYMKYALNKSLKNGETYEKMGLSTDDNVELSTNNLPNIWVSLAPLVSLITIIIVFSHVANIVLIALTVAILMAAVLMNKQLESQKTTLNDGAVGSVMPTLSTAFTVAFGATLTSAPAFLAIQQSILNIPGNPLISLAVATVLLSFVTGSSVGTVGIVMNSFAKTYLEMGVPAVLIHRISAIAGGVFGVMPHTGLVIVYNNVAKLDLKSSFKYQFMTVNVGHFIALIVSLILSGILY